jgi:hypothetical protein
MTDPRETPEYLVDMAVWDLECTVDDLSSHSHTEPDLVAREYHRLTVAHMRLGNILTHFALKEAAE